MLDFRLPPCTHAYNTFTLANVDTHFHNHTPVHTHTCISLTSFLPLDLPLFLSPLSLLIFCGV
eukprot:m.32854 g.32854  ORF g.32854 m.32854 type:complete len:63 (+) comp9554_c0_seq3:112-300(+)